MRTCSMMVLCDGQGRAVYHVMRGPTRVTPKGQRVFLSGKAQTVHVYNFPAGVPRLSYPAMTGAHATPEAPAIEWQR